MARGQWVGVVIELDFAGFADNPTQKVQGQCPRVVCWSGRNDHDGLCVGSLFLTGTVSHGTGIGSAAHKLRKLAACASLNASHSSSARRAGETGLGDTGEHHQPAQHTLIRAPLQ
jgi:hypothetical protein